MVKNCYFQCKTCGHIECKFIDDCYIEGVIKGIICDNCGSNTFIHISDASKINEGKVKIKNTLKDNRSINKEKYISQEYKDKRAEIDRVHRQKTGLLGKDKLKYLI